MKKARILTDTVLIAAMLMAYVPGAIDSAYASLDIPALIAPAENDQPLLLLTDGREL